VKACHGIHGRRDKNGSGIPAINKINSVSSVALSSVAFSKQVSYRAAKQTSCSERERKILESCDKLIVSPICRRFGVE
jgi:hypothetical protein